MEPGGWREPARAWPLTHEGPRWLALLALAADARLDHSLPASVQGSARSHTNGARRGQSSEVGRRLFPLLCLFRLQGGPLALCKKRCACFWGFSAVSTEKAVLFSEMENLSKETCQGEAEALTCRTSIHELSLFFG